MTLINCKIQLKLNGQSIVFCLQLVLIMLRLILTILFSPSKTQNYIYQQETIKNYQHILAKGLKDQFIGINLKQKIRVKIRQILLESIDRSI